MIEKLDDLPAEKGDHIHYLVRLGYLHLPGNRVSVGDVEGGLLDLLDMSVHLSGVVSLSVHLSVEMLRCLGEGVADEKGSESLAVRKVRMSGKMLHCRTLQHDHIVLDVVIESVHLVNDVVGLLLAERPEEFHRELVVTVRPSVPCPLHLEPIVKVLDIPAVYLVDGVHQEEGHQRQDIVLYPGLCPLLPFVRQVGFYYLFVVYHTSLI